MTQTCLIVGASHGGSQAAISLRQSGWDGRIVLVGDEADLPYHRPPLSKDYMSGDKALDEILLRGAAVYDKAEVDLRLGTRVTEINRNEKSVQTQGGDSISYDKLILATGARVRKIPIAGADHDHVFYLRDSKDVRAIKSKVAGGKNVVIIGGGYIGLETAASLKKQGLNVTVLEAMDRILQRVTAPVMSDFYRRIHTEEGVNIVESEMASSIEEDDGMLAVTTSDGHRYPADFVIVGIGVIPNTELAADAGLTVGNGIEVNEFCQTNDPDIYAIGDVTWHHNPIYDVNLRLESVPNATEQAKTAALHICGKPKPYSSLPWFWSDQFDLKLQIAGLFQGFDNIVLRGDPSKGRQLAAFYFKGDRFLAVDAVNDPKAFMFSRMSLTKGHQLDKSILADPDGDLKSAIIAS